MADVEKTVQENGEVPKTAKQLEKEAKKQAKLDKLKQKLEKQQNVAPPKKDVEVRYILLDGQGNFKFFKCRKRKRRKR